MKHLLQRFPFNILSMATNPLAFATFAEGDGDGDGPQGGGSPQGVLPDGVMESFDKLLDKFDSERQAAMELFHENKQYRDKNRELQDQVEKMQEVGDDQVVVDKEQYNSYKEVVQSITEEEDPEKAKEQIDSLKQDSQQLAKERDRRKKENVASEYGWNKEAFRDLFADHELEKKTRENDDGEQEDYYVVVEEGEDGTKEVEVSDYVNQKYEHMKPALEQEQDKSQTRSYPPQQPHRSDDEGSGDLVDEFINNQNQSASKPNKLDKATGRANGSQES